MKLIKLKPLEPCRGTNSDQVQTDMDKLYNNQEKIYKTLEIILNYVQVIAITKGIDP